MRVGVPLGTRVVDPSDEFCTAEAIAEIAAEAETLGFDALTVTDHPAPHPVAFVHGAHHALDPFVSLSVAAVATSTLRLQLNIAVLPYRNPFLLAKAIASLDVVSGGRVELGGGTGYLREEFSALGVDFDERNRLTDEALEVVRLAWSGDPVEFVGRHFRADGVESRPRPVQMPHPPIWIGGNSWRAIRRAVQYGYGWLPVPTRPSEGRGLRSAAIDSYDELARRIEYAKAYASETGRTEPLEIAFYPDRWGLQDPHQDTSDAGAPAAVVRSAERLRSIGVTALLLTVRASRRTEHIAKLRSLARVLPELHGL